MLFNIIYSGMYCGICNIECYQQEAYIQRQGWGDENGQPAQLNLKKEESLKNILEKKLKLTNSFIKEEISWPTQLIFFKAGGENYDGNLMKRIQMKPK